MRPALSALLALAFAACSARHSSCRTFPELNSIPCRITAARVTIPPRALSNLAFSNGRPAPLLVNNRDFYFVTRTGNTAPAFPFDNGPDDFAEGLARTIVNAKIGFVDAELNLVIAPAWDFATPFHNGRARVCTGCVPQRIGEHTAMTGGVWQEIDRSGRVVRNPSQ